MPHADQKNKKQLSLISKLILKTHILFFLCHFLSCITASPWANSWTVCISRIPFLVQGTDEPDELIYYIYTIMYLWCLTTIDIKSAINLELEFKWFFKLIIYKWDTNSLDIRLMLKFSSNSQSAQNKTWFQWSFIQCLVIIIWIDLEYPRNSLYRQEPQSLGPNVVVNRHRTGKATVPLYLSTWKGKELEEIR